jgi:hypothetical protein
VAKKAAKAVAGTKPGGANKLRAASDFLDFAWEWGESAWVLLAVEAPIERVAPAYARLANARHVHERVPVRPAAGKKELGVTSYLVPVVQLAGGGWTTLHRVVGMPIGAEDIEHADALATKLSAQLETRAATFVGEDTSGAMELHLFDNGKRGATKEWDQELDVADASFAKLGLAVPACYARGAGPCLITASPAWAQRIERADLFDLGDE